MSDIRTKAATDDYRRNWDACFGKGPNSRTTWDAVPHEHVEPPTRVLYRCLTCRVDFWDVETGNPRLCMTCGDHCEPITRNRGPAVESFPSSSSSLPVARCPECNRPWSPEP